MAFSHRLDGQVVDQYGNPIHPDTGKLLVWITAPVWFPIAVLQAVVFIVFVVFGLLWAVVTVISGAVEAVSVVVRPVVPWIAAWFFYTAPVHVVVSSALAVGSTRRALATTDPEEASTELWSAVMAVVCALVAFGFAGYDAGVRPAEVPVVATIPAEVGPLRSAFLPRDDSRDPIARGVAVVVVAGECRFTDALSGLTLVDLEMADGDFLRLTSTVPVEVGFQLSSYGGLLPNSADFSVPAAPGAVDLEYRLGAFRTWPGVPPPTFTCAVAGRDGRSLTVVPQRHL